MLVYRCDRCGKICKQVLHVTVNLECKGYADEWSTRGVTGDYCQQCFDEIAETAHKAGDNA